MDALIMNISSDHMCYTSHRTNHDINLQFRSQISADMPSNFQVMNWQNLYQKQLYENRELKKQLKVVESILRNFLPIIETDDDQEN